MHKHKQDVLKFLIIGLYLLVTLVFIYSCNSNNISNLKENKPTLFTNDTFPIIKLSANFKTIFKDINEKRFYHTGELSYFSEKEIVKIPISIKTRGYFRRDTAICNLMPLKLKFKKKEVKNTAFETQTKLKLVLPCTYDSIGEQLLLREYLCYKFYETLTPYSFKTQVIELKFSTNKKKIFAFFIENKKAMSKRNDMVCKEIPYLQATETNDYILGLTSVFQYMIGNNDWSIYYLHNIKLLFENKFSEALTVPYDFDMAGFVDAPYTFASSSEIKDSMVSLQSAEREYLGGKRSKEELKYIFNLFIEKRDTFNSIINNCESLNKQSKTHCFRYINEFYETIGNDSLVHTIFQCGE